MPLSLVFYAFLVRMAAGTLVSLLPLLSLRAADRHNRFQVVFCLVAFSGCAALYLPALGETLHPDWPRGMAAFTSFKGAMPGTMILLGALCLAANVLLGTYRRKAARIVLYIATFVSLIAVLGTARIGAEGMPYGALGVLALSALLGGMLMGGINNAMILGHFYLMIKGLPLAALKRAGWFVAGVVLVKMAVFGAVLIWWDGAFEILLGREMVWTAWRVAFGFVGPLVLLFMVKDTVRLAHTQAATGLLYVAVGFALMGELAATWLELNTGIPT